MGVWSWLRGRRKGSSGPVGSGCGPTEVEDARQVDEALRLLQEGKRDEAVALLRQVIARAPADYAPTYEAGGKLHVKSWDLREFLEYEEWAQARGESRPLAWLLSAYPRACYYLGSLLTEAGDHAGAVVALDAGLRLEPGSAALKCARAQALIRQRQHVPALALYDEVLAGQGFLSTANRALALRGRGVVLIEMGRLDEAERAFRDSQTVEPDSPVAHGELAYIAQLRQKEGPGAG